MFYEQGQEAALVKLGFRGLGSVAVPAGIGAGLGALAGDEDTRLRNALVGALAGGGMGLGGLIGKSRALTGTMTGARHYSPLRNLERGRRGVKAWNALETGEPLSPYVLQDLYQGATGLRGQLLGGAAGLAGGLGLGAGIAGLDAARDRVRQDIIEKGGDPENVQHDFRFFAPKEQ